MKKVTKRVVSILLTLCIMCGGVALLPLTVSATGETPEYYGTLPIKSLSERTSLDKSGRDVNVAWSISSEKEFKNFGTLINASECFGETFILTADINYNPDWTASETAPVADENDWGTWNHATKGGKWFGGTFDGQGHTISGLYVKATSNNSGPDGLGMFCGFKSNDNKATVGSANTQYPVYVKNFSLVNSYFEDEGKLNSDGIGAIAGDIRNDTIATVENVYVGSDVTVTKGGENVGGIIGLQCGATNQGSLTISNCVFAGKATGAHTVGGILGYANNADGKVVIKNCVNTGKLSETADNANATKIGGIIGAYYNASGTIENCINLGEISISNTTNDGNNGDILGFIDTKVTNTNLKFVNCYYTNGLGRKDNNAPRGVGENCTYYSGTTSYVDKEKYEAAFNTAANSKTWKALAVEGGLEDVLKNSFGAFDVVDIKYQLNTEDDSIRFIGVLKLEEGELADYDELGFNISMTYDGKSYTKNITTSTVYESIIANNETVFATEHGGNYFFIVEITGMDGVTATDAKFHVTAKVTPTNTAPQVAETVSYTWAKSAAAA